MLVTLLPIVTEVKEEQFRKAEPPMLVTLLGIVTEVKEEQYAKAAYPILVTLFGIVTELKEEQPWKALAPIPITLSPMTYSVTCEPNLCDKLESREYCLFTIASELIVTDVKEEQPSKA